jgi:hypothetical protein
MELGRAFDRMAGAMVLALGAMDFAGPVAVIRHDETNFFDVEYTYRSCELAYSSCHTETALK